LNSRTRFERAMAHQAGDRPPLDIGGTTLTAMSARCQQALKEFLGFSGPPSFTNAGVDERILEWAGSDFRSVGGIVDLPSVHTRALSPTAHVDCWGVRRERVGQYDEITAYPLRGATIDDLRSFPWPEPRVDGALLERWERRARELKGENRYVIVAEHPVYGILELGCWMCGYDDFLIRFATEPDFVHAFFARVLEIQLQVIEPYYSVLGPYIDLTTSGDDFGMQMGPLISPQMFEEFIAPYFSARIGRTKALGQCTYWHHSCGSVYALLDRMIACGVDILNPVQTSAAQMDPRTLKARFGDRLVFWGGVDVQQFLPTATPEQVREQVLALVETLGQGGGYVVAPAHNMQDDIPPENIVAWVEAVQERPRPLGEY
jgi:uroporphyrinogen decarboxylase